MTLKDFITKWDGKFCEVAGSADAMSQCVDLANAYLRDVWGLPIVEWTNACDFPSKVDADYIKNTPEGIPHEGDVVVWNKNSGGGYGHIAVFIEGSVNKFTSFDQNWPTGTPCHKQGHYYTNVDGWLRKKGTMSDDEITIKKSTFEDLVRKSSLYDEFTATGYGSATEVKQLISDLRKSIDDKQAAIDSEKERAETIRKDFNDFVAMVAIAVGTVQEVPQIKVRLDQIETSLNDLEDIQRAYATLELSSGKDKEELNAEIARLKAMLANEDVLENAKLEELLREIVRRLSNILKRK